MDLGLFIGYLRRKAVVTKWGLYQIIDGSEVTAAPLWEWVGTNMVRSVFGEFFPHYFASSSLICCDDLGW